MATSLGPRGPITLESIWEGMQQSELRMMAHIDSKLEPINARLDKIDRSLSTLGDRVSLLEERTGKNEDDITDMVERIKQLEKANAYLMERAEDAENRSRSQNLRFISVPEKSEGSDIHDFMSKLIPHLLGAENFASPPAIERCHRSPTFITPRTDGQANKPRPILVRFLRYQEKVRIQNLAREKGPLYFAGKQVYIFPDFSAALLKKRAKFDPVKKRFKDLHITYAMHFPATLSITHNNKSLRFDTHTKAEACASKLESGEDIDMD